MQSIYPGYNIIYTHYCVLYKHKPGPPCFFFSHRQQSPPARNSPPFSSLASPVATMSADKAIINEDEHPSKEQSSYLPPEYRDYLISRHGTVDLDPLPDMTDADPYNWPKWKVNKYKSAHPAYK